VVSSLRHFIVDLKHRSNLFLLDVCLGRGRDFFSLVDPLPGQVFDDFVCDFNKVMFGSHSDTFTLFFLVWLIPFTVKFRFFHTLLGGVNDSVCSALDFIFYCDIVTL
jgi:hypothetical protein